MYLYLKLFLVFIKIGAFSFGGGYSMIPLISREIVETNKWLTMQEFIDVVAISQATPGPIGINSATYVGYKVGGFLGSLVATTGVVLPSLAIMVVLGTLFLKYRQLVVVQDIFSGVRPAVAALIVAAAVSVFRSSITGVVPVIIAAVAVTGILAFRLDPVLFICLAGIVGFLLYR